VSPKKKKCTKCKKNLLVTSFWVDRSTRDGRKFWCPECMLRNQKRRRAKAMYRFC